MGIVLFIVGVGPNTFGVLNVEATLKAIAGNRAGYILEQVIFPLGGFLFIPAVLALYTSLKDVNKSYALLGSGLALASLTALLSENAGNALLTLSDQYSAANTDAQRQVFVTAAQAVNALSSAQTASGYVAGIGFLIIGAVMLRSVFHKGLAYLGMLTGILILVANLPFIGFSFLLFIITIAVWSIGVGLKLYRLG